MGRSTAQKKETLDSLQDSFVFCSKGGKLEFVLGLPYNNQSLFGSAQLQLHRI